MRIHHCFVKVLPLSKDCSVAILGVGNDWTSHFAGAVLYRHLYLSGQKLEVCHGKGKPGEELWFWDISSLSFYLPAIIKGQGLVTCSLPRTHLAVQPVTFQNCCFAASSWLGCLPSDCVCERLYCCAQSKHLQQPLRWKEVTCRNVEKRKGMSAPLAACEPLKHHLGPFLKVSRCLQVLIGTQRDFPKPTLLKVFRH